MIRQPLKWHGGKFYMAPKIIPLMPKHARYLEPYAGGLAVLIRKPYEGIAEWANDTHKMLTNFWQVISNPITFDDFYRRVSCVPLSEEAFDLALADTTPDYPITPVEKKVVQAVNFFVSIRQSRQGLGKDYCTPTSRLRRGMNEQVSAWLSSVEGLPEVHERLKRVEIWNRPAIKAIKDLNHPDLFVYADPPYMLGTRGSGAGEYGPHEMSDRAHAILLATLSSEESFDAFVEKSGHRFDQRWFERMSGAEIYDEFVHAASKPFLGKFMLSGYQSDLYDQFAEVFSLSVAEFDLPNNASGKRTKERKKERVWMNYQISEDQPKILLA